MDRVIITGVGGFIGGALAKKLLEQDVVVYGVDISLEVMQRFISYEKFIPIVADFATYEKLDESIIEGGDVFFHFALKGSFGPALKDYSLQLYNADGACKALEAAVRCKCKKFVLAGTANEYELKNYINMDYFEPRYTCVYSTGKLAAEFICKTLAYNNGIEYCGGLIAMAYGEGNKSTTSLPNVIIHQILNKQEPKLITGNNLYDMVYISEIVDSFIAIGQYGKNMKSYYIGHRKLKTFREMMERIRNILNPDILLHFGAYEDGPSGMDYSLIDIDALYNDTGFECKTDFKKSILKTAEWIKTMQF